MSWRFHLRTSPPENAIIERCYCLLSTNVGYAAIVRVFLLKNTFKQEYLCYLFLPLFE